MHITEALSLGDKAVVSIVGAGGKTSLMYSLAHELASAGNKVLTTTTTKIFMPTHEECTVTIVSKTIGEVIEKAHSLIRNCPHLTVATEYLPEQGKLNGLHPDFLKQILSSDIFDYIIVEADGAAQKPLKACGPHEPVVPEFSDRIVSLVGLDAVGKPLVEQWVFRSRQFSNIAGLPLEHRITEASIAETLIHDMKAVTAINENTLKIAFLNKADNDNLLSAGERVADILEEKGRDIFHRIVIGELREEPLIHRCRVLN